MGVAKKAEGLWIIDASEGLGIQVPDPKLNFVVFPSVKRAWVFISAPFWGFGYA
jgi:hypothetical protein